MKKSYLLALSLSTFFASSTFAAVSVYTDKSAWEAAVFAGPFDHFHSQDFEAIDTGPLLAGENFFFPLLVSISGAPGFNAIDDSLTSDPFFDTLSPNGSTYYSGDVGFSATTAPVLSFPELDFGVSGFGADWVVQGDLFMEVQGELISFSQYLPTGAGFLGIVTDQPESPLVASLSGAAVFGVDNIRTANTPVPASVWLFGCGVLGLAGFVRRKAGS